jgi:putative ABC transport system substrate-binding protein
MKRREFITLLGGAAAWPLAARAQRPAMPVVGWLSSRSAGIDALVLPAFRQALNAQGYVEGRNVTVEYRYADGFSDRLPALATDLARRRVAVVVAVGASVSGTRALQAATTTIPILAIFGSDPTESGYVASLNRPGGNVTGVVVMQSQVGLGSKRMGLVHDLLPRAATIAVLVDPQQDSAAAQTTDVQEAARALGLRIEILNAGTERDLDAAFAALVRMQPDALFVAQAPFFFTHLDQIVAATTHLALATSYFRREFVTAGGLMSYASNADDAYAVLGNYTGRILNGEKPGDLPIQQPTRFELVINLRTAKALGIDVPPILLARADEVIE